jgi:hypothetical protein
MEGGGGGTEENGGKEVICTQSYVLAQRAGVPRLSRTPARGAPPNLTRPPPTSCSRPAVLQAALPLSPLPSPQGCTQRIKTTIGLYMTPSGDVDFLSCPLEVSCSHLGHDQSPKFPDPSMLAEPGTLSLESTLLPPPPPRPGRPVGHQAPAENMAVWYQGKHCT